MRAGIGGCAFRSVGGLQSTGPSLCAAARFATADSTVQRVLTSILACVRTSSMGRTMAQIILNTVQQVMEPNFLVNFHGMPTRAGLTVPSMVCQADR